MHMTARAIGLCLALFTLSSLAASQNWPGWRGDGTGVSAEKGLPEKWGPETNVRWKTAIVGDSISSPIVWEDKVFVTTAYEGTVGVVSRWVVYTIGLGLLLLALVSLVAGRSRPAGASGWKKFVFGLDRFTALGAFCLFVVGVVLMLAMKDLIDPGSANRAWRISGGVAVVGLVAAVGWVGVRSSWRVLGALLLVAAAVFYHLAVPGTKGHGPILFKELILASVPLCLAAVWSVWVFFLARKGEGAGGTTLRTVGAMAVLVAAVLQFVLFNALVPRTALLRSVICLDRTTGEIRWQNPVFQAPGGQKHRINSYATPTPATDGKHLVVDFGMGLACLDLDGNLLWKKEEPKYNTYLRYGAADSPILFENLVIYSFMPEWQGTLEGIDQMIASGHLTALDKETGKVVWQVRPPGGFDSYDTPHLTRIGDRPALLLATCERALAYEVRTGRLIWSCKIPLTQCVPSIVSDDKRAYVLGGTHGPKGAFAINLQGEGDVTETNIVWQLKRGIPQCPSPVLYGGLLYFVSDGGVATCLEADTGKQVWKKRLGGRHLASLVAGDDKVYFFAVSGQTRIIRAGRNYEELASCTIGEELLASPAISRGEIFLRGSTYLYCISQGNGTEKSRSSG